MNFSPRVRRAALTAHVSTSVGWLGAVLAALVLAIAARVVDDLEVSSAILVSLDVLGRFVLVPLAFAALITGLLMSFGTAWGLVRHYWVVIKLGLTVVATVVLLAYTQTLATLAQAAGRDSLSAGDATLLRTNSVIIHATAALAVLFFANVLAVFKPRGLTPYGWRRVNRTNQ